MAGFVAVAAAAVVSAVVGSIPAVYSLTAVASDQTAAAGIVAKGWSCRLTNGPAGLGMRFAAAVVDGH